MSSNSKIEWTEHTFNPWHGCAKVYPGCKNCYAETLTNRWGGDHWGIHAGRKFMSDAYWKKPIQWNKKAEKAGRIDRVFSASMADVFEIHSDPAINEQMNEARYRLFKTITETPSLMWLLLTKRPENIINLVPITWVVEFPENVCIMTSVENQYQADTRIPHLLTVPAKYRGLSVEPLLDSVNLSHWFLTSYNGEVFVESSESQIQWVIVGGESGPKARPMHPDWAREIRDQCEGVTNFFFKQWGLWVHGSHDAHGRVEWHDLGDDAGAIPMKKVGKKTAGRLLDGKEYNEHPFNLIASEVLPK